MCLHLQPVLKNFQNGFERRLGEQKLKFIFRYAREDTHYLLYIYDRIRLDLHKQEGNQVHEIFRQSKEISLLRVSDNN